MKKCPFSAEEIQDAAVVCKHCNRDLAASSGPQQPTRPRPPKQGVLTRSFSCFSVTGLLVLLGVGVGCCVLLLVIGAFSGGGTPSEPPRTNRSSKRSTLTDAQVEERVTALLANGVVQKIEAGHYVYVDSATWHALNVDGKKGLCAVLADYAALHGGLAWVEVYDYRTGKKLAKLGSWGFEVY